MKHISLGDNAIALEPSGDAERVDAVPKEFFKKNGVSPSAYRLYEKYIAKTSERLIARGPKWASGD